MKVKKIMLWIVRLLIVSFFLMAGIGKLTGTELQIQSFIHWGYPIWFMYVIGAAETLGAILILIPKTSKIGNIWIFLLMAGALVTHIKTSDPFSMWVPMIVAVILLTIHLVLLKKTKTQTTLAQPIA